jgi:hypothetical protein
MLRFAWFSLFASVAVSAAAQHATPASAPVNPRTIQLFQSDWVLMNWALKFHDADRDILLSPLEADTAADAFREIADADGDGRVTPPEYRAARAFIIARY